MSTVEAPLTRRGRETRERIVDAAASLMFERGVAGTTTSDVQKAAGVSGSQLYHYFADKQALVRAVVAHQTELVLGMQEPLFAKLDSIEGLRAWRDALVAFKRETAGAGGCPIGSLAAELADTDPDARSDLAAAFTRWEAALRAGLQAMRDRGELGSDANPERLALALLAAMQGGVLLTQVRRDTAPLEAAVDAVIDHVASFGR